MLLNLYQSLWHDLRHRLQLLRAAVLARGDRHARPARDAGVSTLEMVIIALGLIAVATLLVAAITAAVTRRTDQLQ